MPAELLARVRAEIDGRLAELRPAVAEYERLLGATDALGSRERASVPARASRAPSSAKAGPASKRAVRAYSRRRTVRGGPKQAGGATQQAIVAALEHGSHTVSELALVTAMPGADIRAGLRPLLKSGTVVRARRDGRAAYALSSSAGD